MLILSLLVVNTIFDVFLPRRDIGWRRDFPNQDWIPESSPNEGHYEPWQRLILVDLFLG